MGKVIDITEKLNFQDNPVMKLGDLEVEVNADAETMIRLMGAFKSKSEMEAVMDAMNLIFQEEDIPKICAMRKNGKKMTASSLVTIVNTAVELVMEDELGE